LAICLTPSLARNALTSSAGLSEQAPSNSEQEKMAAVSDGLNGIGSIYLDMNGLARPWQCQTKTRSPTIMRNIVMDDRVKKRQTARF
jgi:hypothetical protein